MSMPLRFAALSGLICLFQTCSLFAQVKLPKPPDQYDVELRYSIKADRIQRFKQFDEMTTYLGKLGFNQTETDESDTDAENPSANRMAGKIPSDTARKILGERHIQSLILTPSGYKYPENPSDRVKVLLELEKGFASRSQQQFFEQVRTLLTERLGYSDGISYDHRNHTILRGTIATGSIPSLLLDLRTLPTGWFFAEIPFSELPEPLRNVLPIRLVEVTPEPEGVPSVGPLPKTGLLNDPLALAKMPLDLQALIASQPEREKLRLEVFLSEAPSELRGNDWQAAFAQIASGLKIEGRLGQICTVSVARADDALRLAQAPFITAIRLPRYATPSPAVNNEKPKEKSKDPEPKVQFPRIILVVDKIDALKESKLDQLHLLNKKGFGIRVVIVDADFAGYRSMIGKGLNEKTKLIDWTADRNESLEPEPFATPEGKLGHGTHCALAAALAAPEAELILVRIDPGAPYQVQNTIRFISGEVFEPEAFKIRQLELDDDLQSLKARTKQVLEDFRKAHDNFDDTPEARKARLDSQAAVKDLDVMETALIARLQRLRRLEINVNGLKGADMVICPLVWNSGHALDGNGYLSQVIDDKLTLPLPLSSRRRLSQPVPKNILWFNAAGDTRGQTWMGHFQDRDGNGIMEFATAQDSIRPEKWTRELNFFAFESLNRDLSPELPANARVRVTLQWREPHDPELNEAEYREPNASFRMALLRQRDPEGKNVPSDELELAARSDGPAIRLEKQPQFGIYEKVVEVNLTTGGRYALRLDGVPPQFTRPRGIPSLPGNEILFDLKPRIFVEVLDAETREKGRVVFQDYQTLLGGVGMPADARSVFTVGAATLDRKPQPFSAVGGGPGMEMIQKPDLWAFDELPIPQGPAKGTSLSSSFAGGIAASFLSAEVSRLNFLDSIGLKRRQILEVNDKWFSERFKKK